MYILFPRLRLRVSAFALPGALLLIYCEGLLPFCILFLSCLLHEFGHLAALCICKCRYRRMDILPMGALIVCPAGMPYKKELAVALAGAFCNSLVARNESRAALQAAQKELAMYSDENIVLKDRLSKLVSAENIDRIATQKLGLVKIVAANETYLDSQKDNEVLFSQGK